MKKVSLIAVLFAGSVVSVKCAGTEVDPRLKVLAYLKHQQMERLAIELHLDVPAEARKFFKAAEAGDCTAVSNTYARIQQLTGQSTSSIQMPGYPSVLNVPIHETRGAYEFCDWDSLMLLRYARGILDSIPNGSVYFGGTDPGRFLITMFLDVVITKSPDVTVLTPKFIITQNALIDTRYVEYLQLTRGDRLWLPSTNDIERAFHGYASELRERQGRGEQLGPNEQLDSSNHVHGVAAAMNINGILTKWIFDRNKDKHPFFVEESYVIPWMYPYMEPHGLILKLNNEKLANLDPAAIVCDREFWAKLSKELLADPKFLANEGERKTYSKMRSAIGGLYMYRKLWDEAEAAYKQAITLCPGSPEASFRLVQLYVEQGRRDEAVAVLEQLQKLDLGNDKIAAAIRQIRSLPRE